MSEFQITPTDRRLLAALDADGDMTPPDLADLLGYDSHKWISKKLCRLRDAELIRVAKWIRNTDGPAIPVYSVTPGESAPRPKAMGWSTWSKRYRKNLKARGGEQYLKARRSLTLLARITSSCS
jgi:predicted ArsR family transcriptional regulator